MKNIYEQFNNIEFDIDKLNSTNIEIDEFTKKKLKKNLKVQTKKCRKKKLYKRTAISAAAFLLVFSLACRNESFVAFASNIPVLGSVFETFESSDKKAEFSSYSKKIGETQKSNGYEVKIDEVVIDDYLFMITYTINSKEKLSIKEGLDLVFLTTHDEGFPFTGNTTKLNNKELIGAGSGDAKLIDEHTVQILEVREVHDLNLENNINLDINIRKIKSTRGKWHFKIPVSKEKVSKNIKKFNPNVKLKVHDKNGNDATLLVDEVSFSPISTNIHLKSKDDIPLSGVTFKDASGNILVSLSGSAGADYTSNEFYILHHLETMKEIPNKILVEYKHEKTNTIYKTEINFK